MNVTFIGYLMPISWPWQIALYIHWKVTIFVVLNWFADFFVCSLLHLHLINHMEFFLLFSLIYPTNSLLKYTYSIKTCSLYIFSSEILNLWGHRENNFLNIHILSCEMGNALNEKIQKTATTSLYIISLKSEVIVHKLYGRYRKCN